MFPCLHLYKAASSVLPLVLTPPPSPNHSWQVAALLYVLPVLEGVYLVDWCWDHSEGERLRDFHLHPSHTSQSRYLSFSLCSPFSAHHIHCDTQRRNTDAPFRGPCDSFLLPVGL